MTLSHDVLESDVESWKRLVLVREVALEEADEDVLRAQDHQEECEKELQAAKRGLRSAQRKLRRVKG